MLKFSLKFFYDIFNIMFMFGMSIERLITLSHSTCQGMPSLTLVHNEHILVSLPFDLNIYLLHYGVYVRWNFTFKTCPSTTLPWASTSSYHIHGALLIPTSSQPINLKNGMNKVIDYWNLTTWTNHYAWKIIK